VAGIWYQVASIPYWDSTGCSSINAWVAMVWRSSSACERPIPDPSATMSCSSGAESRSAIRSAASAMTYPLSRVTVGGEVNVLMLVIRGVTRDGGGTGTMVARSTLAPVAL
jgi:hypothetical protein